MNPEAQNSTIQNSENGQNEVLPQEKLENNLVTFCSNVLKIYALEDSSINLRLSTQFNDKILDVIKVPTKQFVLESKKAKQQETIKKPSPKPTKKSGRSSRRNVDLEQVIINTEAADDLAMIDEDFEAPDYLFIVTQGFNVALLNHNVSNNSIDVVSRGKIAEQMHERKDPPYPIFLGQTGNFIALMLYQNIIKVIPLVAQD